MGINLSTIKESVLSSIHGRSGFRCKAALEGWCLWNMGIEVDGKQQYRCDLCDLLAIDAAKLDEGKVEVSRCSRLAIQTLSLRKDGRVTMMMIADGDGGIIAARKFPATCPIVDRVVDTNR